MLIKGLMLMLLMGVIYSIPVANNPVVAQTPKRYVCPMHPKVTSNKPGKCYICKMALRPTRPKQIKPAPPETKPTESGAVSSPRIPDVTVQDQNGKSLNFYSDLVKGKVVAVNFVFTTCTAICPSLTATFRRVQQQLAEQKVQAQLISVSVDPTADTPERLQQFAAKFKAEPGWTFVTGNIRISIQYSKSSELLSQIRTITRQWFSSATKKRDTGRARTDFHLRLHW